MKYGILLSCVLIFFLQGCEALKTISFNKNIIAEFCIDPEDISDLVYYAEETLDLSSDPDLGEYTDQLTEVNLKNISYEIEGYSGPDYATFLGKVGIGDVSISSPSVLAETETVVLDEITDQEVRTLIDFSNDDLRTIENIFIVQGKMRVSLEGQFSEMPSNFKLRVYAFMTIKTEVEE